MFKFYQFIIPGIPGDVNSPRRRKTVSPGLSAVRAKPYKNTEKTYFPVEKRRLLCYTEVSQS
jgi:hypothetical protein